MPRQGERDCAQDTFFVAEHCPIFVLSLPKNEMEILAPPVADCLECGSQLVSHHSCDIKLYSLNGAKVLATKTNPALSALSIALQLLTIWKYAHSELLVLPTVATTVADPQWWFLYGGRSTPGRLAAHPGECAIAIGSSKLSTQKPHLRTVLLYCYVRTKVDYRVAS